MPNIHVPPTRRLCVYCGSSPGNSPAYLQAAHRLGLALAEAGIGLVYGGGSIGLMGEVARATLKGGGHVTGIIPEFLVQKERMLDGVNELIVTRSMHERKTLMFEKSAGFVALPGGIGTLEELAEMATWAQLARHNKPIIVCDINGYWSHLLSLLNHMKTEGFIRPETEVDLAWAKAAEDVVPLFEQRLQRDKPRVAIEAVRNQL